MSLFGVFWTSTALRGDIFGRYLASFLQVEFVGCWSATESDAYTGQVRGFVWWSLEAFRGLITFSSDDSPVHLHTATASATP